MMPHTYFHNGEKEKSKLMHYSCAYDLYETLPVPSLGKIGLPKRCIKADFWPSSGRFHLKCNAAKIVSYAKVLAF